MPSDIHFVHDAATVEFHEDQSGIVRDGDETTIDWEEVETVTVDDVPIANGFDTKEFHRLRATVARPIPQPYRYSEDTVVLKKPREELKDAAWSLRGAPWTMGHPDSGMVKDRSDVHGYWDDPRYIDSVDDLDSFLHIPANDEEAKNYLERNTDVSVGFYNRVVRTDEYDGVVGGTDDDTTIDGYQTDLLFDHVASVQQGRCPGSEGCGIGTDELDGEADGDNHGVDSVSNGADAERRRRHGHLAPVAKECSATADCSCGGHTGDGLISTALITEGNEDTEPMQETTDAPDGIYVADGTWYAVGPDDHTKDSTDHTDDAMYPVDSCDDIEDAWNLRSHGEDLSIEQSTLESRIKRAAEAKDCSGMPWQNEDSQDTTMEIDTDDKSAELVLAQIRDEHDGLDEKLEQYEEALDAVESAVGLLDDDTDLTNVVEAASEAADALDTDIEDLGDEAEDASARVEELESRIDELEQPKMEEHAEFIAERTDRFGEDADAVIENADGLDDLEDKRELVEDLAEGYDEMHPGADEQGEGTKDEAPTVGGYARTPWE